MKKSDREEVEKLRRVAEEAVTLRKRADDLQEQSQRLHYRVEEVRKRIANLRSAAKGH